MLHEARIYSCPLVCSQPVSLRAITKYLLAGWNWNKRAGGQRKPRQMSGSLVWAINNHSNYHHLLRAAFLNWYQRAKTNKKIFIGYEVCGLQTHLDQITFQSGPPYFLTLPGGWGAREMFGPTQGPRPGDQPSTTHQAPSPGLPIWSDDAFPSGKWIMSDQKPF